MERSLEDPLREDIRKTHDEPFDWLTSPTEAFLTNLDYAIMGVCEHPDVEDIRDAKFFTYKGVLYCIEMTENSWDDGKSLSPAWSTLRCIAP